MRSPKGLGLSKPLHSLLGKLVNLKVCGTWLEPKGRRGSVKKSQIQRKGREMQGYEKQANRVGWGGMKSPNCPRSLKKRLLYPNALTDENVLRSALRRRSSSTDFGK